MNTVAVTKMADEWRSVGVCEGDVLLLHSDIQRLVLRYMDMGLMIKPKDILESFLIAIGPTGTLLLPLFNFDFNKGVPFDIRTTPSHMGALTNAGRLHPSAVRTRNPIYSFAVIGAKAERFKDVDNFSAYGSDSPFAILRELNGKIAVLDLPDSASMTFIHHVEEMCNVDYRYHKKFEGSYTDADGRTERRVYGMFVRNLEKGVLSDSDPAGELMWKNGLYSGCRPNEGCGLRVISACRLYDFVVDIIKSGQSLNHLYRIEGGRDK